MGHLAGLVDLLSRRSEEKLVRSMGPEIVSSAELVAEYRNRAGVKD